MNFFYNYIEAPHLPGDAYDYVFLRAKKTATELLGKPRKDIVSTIYKNFPETSQLDVVTFSRYFIESKLRKMRDKAVKYMVLEEYDRAARLLRLSVNSGIDSFYSIVNYAILNAICHKFKEALKLYSVALTYEASGPVDSIIREEIVKCLLCCHEYETALKEAGGLKHRRIKSFWSAVVLYHMGEMNSCRDRLRRLEEWGFDHSFFQLYLNATEKDHTQKLPPPDLRDEPLVAGEGIYHNFPA